MKKTRNKIIAALAVAVCMVFGSLGFAACDSKDKTEKPDYNEQIHAIYEKYAETAGNDALTYEEWLEKIKGKDGKSAYEIWKDNGHQGSESDFLEDLKGDNGSRGSGWIRGTEEPNSEVEAQDGDFYLNSTTWDVYERVDGEWNILGCLSPSGSFKTGGLNVSVAAGATVDYSVPISAGKYVMLADFGSAEFGGTMQVKYGADDIVSQFAYSEARSEVGHKIYLAYLAVTEDIKKISVISTGEGAQAIGATVTLTEYVAPVLKADGVAIEVPVNLLKIADENRLTFKYDSSVTAGDYNFNMSVSGELPVSMFTFQFGVSTQSFGMMAGLLNSDRLKTLTEEDCAADIYMTNTDLIFPLSVKLTPKEAE